MPNTPRLLATSAFLVSLLTAAGCTKRNEGPSLWIYTSLYKNVVQEFDARFKEKFPGVTFHWYQSGSENVAAKVNTELLSGKTQADLILTSDPFWYEDLKARKALLRYDSPAAAAVPERFKDPERYWSTSRMPVMVIAYHTDALAPGQAPKGFADLASPRFKDKIAMPSPLESGTTFTTVAMLSRKLGWDYFARLRANGAISSGGNTAVMARIESKERPVGIVLLENVLATRRRNPKIQAVYPAEGCVPIPSPVAITAATGQPALAKQVYDFILSREGQEIILKGDMHSILGDVRPPEGARAWKEILPASLPWSLATLREIRDHRDDIKKRFSAVMLD